MEEGKGGASNVREGRERRRKGEREEEKGELEGREEGS